MAEHFSPKSKVQFQLDPRSEIQAELSTIAMKGKIGEFKNIDHKGQQIDFTDHRNIDESPVDRLSLLLDRQFSSSQSDPSSDSGLWNQQRDERRDRRKDREDHSWIVQKCQVSGSMAKNHLDVSTKSRNSKTETDNKYNIEVAQDMKKIINGSKDRSESGIKGTILIDNNQLVQCPGNNNSESSRHLSKGTVAELPVTMKTLMDEFNDLTKKMSSLKQTLTDLNACSVNLKPRHSKSYSTDDISVIVDASDARKVIVDCMAELAAIKNYLDGTEKISSEFRDALLQTKIIDCCMERVPHIHGELRKKPTVLAFDTGLTLLDEKDINSGRKKSNSPVNFKENPDSLENSDYSRRRNNFRNEIVASRLELSKKNVGSETVTFVKKETAVSPAFGALKDEKKIDEIQTSSAIVTRDEVAVPSRNVEADSRRKSKRHRWYSCFLDCTRKPEDNDFLDSSQDQSNEHVEKRNKGDKEKKFNEESILGELSVRRSKDQRVLNVSEEKSEFERISVDQKVDSSNFVIQSHGRIPKKLSGTRKKHESPLAILDNMDFLSGHYTQDQNTKSQRDTRAFQVYNALMNKNPSDFRKMYISWLSQPVLNSTIRAAVGLNVSSEFSKIQYTLGASVRNLRKSKSVGFLYFEKSYGSLTFATKKNTENFNIQKATGVMETAKRPVQENLLKDIHEFLHYYLKQHTVSSVNNSKSIRKQLQHYSPEIWNTDRRIRKERKPSIGGTRSMIINLKSKTFKKNKAVENITKNNQLSMSISDGFEDPKGRTKTMKYMQKYSTYHEKDISDNSVIKATCKLHETSCVSRRKLKLMRHPISGTKRILTSKVTHITNEEENLEKVISKAQQVSTSKICLCKNTKITLQNKENDINQTDECKTVWALARVNIFEDGFKTYEILQTTPLAPGRKVNISKVKAIRVGASCNCEK